MVRQIGNSGHTNVVVMHLMRNSRLPLHLALAAWGVAVAGCGGGKPVAQPPGPKTLPTSAGATAATARPAPAARPSNGPPAADAPGAPAAEGLDSVALIS